MSPHSLVENIKDFVNDTCAPFGTRVQSTRCCRCLNQFQLSATKAGADQTCMEYVDSYHDNTSRELSKEASRDRTFRQTSAGQSVNPGNNSKLLTNSQRYSACVD